MSQQKNKRLILIRSKLPKGVKKSTEMEETKPSGGEIRDLIEGQIRKIRDPPWNINPKSTRDL